MDFPSRLKRLRTERKMTQEQLGEKINVTKVSISGYENGNRTPDMETTQKIADFFGVSVDYLLGRTDDPSTGIEKLKEAWMNSRSNYPDWATSRDLRDLKKYIEQKKDLNYDGVPVSDEDKETILRVLTGLFWKSKEKNKRKKKDDNDDE